MGQGLRITEHLIESLLHESEGPALDFKRKQYPFELAGDEEKSELLKDILAFANAFRRTDAFILIGVEEIKGGRSKVSGVAKHLDDASLQQFVNSKTERQVIFSYEAKVHDGLPIGILHIPVQMRPVYTKVNYGKVRKGKVYLRRGSSTGTATPNEIAQMGREDFSAHREKEPYLALHLFDREAGTQMRENTPAILQCVSIRLVGDSSIPDYEGSLPIISGAYNRNYFRELTEYVQDRCFLMPISLAMTNTGSETALDVRLVIELDDSGSKYGFRGQLEMPSLPDRDQFLSNVSGIRGIHDPPQQIDSIKKGKTWRVECRFGKIQPHDTVRLREDLFVGARTTETLSVPGKIYADNLSNPRSVSFDLQIHSDTRKCSLQEIVRQFGR